MAKVGRKPLPDEERKSEKISGYFTRDEKREIVDAAGNSVNALVRRAVLRHVKDLGRPHRKVSEP